MCLINSKQDYQRILTELIVETEQFIDLNPDNMYFIIYNELVEINDVLFVQNRLPEFEEYETLSLCAIAAKNLEEVKPEYAQKLSEIDYYYEMFETLPDNSTI